jgi:hypothetical protein
MPKQILEQYFEGEGESRHLGKTLLCESVEAEDSIA